VTLFEDARVLAATGSVAQAHRALDDLIAAEPDHLGAVLLKADLLLDEREGEQALALYRRAAARWSRSAEALNGLAHCLHTLGDDEEALAVAERAREMLVEGDNARETGPVYLTLVFCLRQMRRFREALAMAEEGLSRCTDAVLAHWAGIVEEELAEAEKERC
jgi:tetratricopeptide (TPR) repeat protein